MLGGCFKPGVEIKLSLEGWSQVGREYMRGYLRCKRHRQMCAEGRVNTTSMHDSEDMSMDREKLSSCRGGQKSDKWYSATSVLMALKSEEPLFIYMTVTYYRTFSILKRHSSRCGSVPTKAHVLCNAARFTGEMISL